MTGNIITHHLDQMNLNGWGKGQRVANDDLICVCQVSSHFEFSA